VVLGSVTDIPFKDNSFDVVHSSGLWEYLTEEEVDKAVKEVYRVGKYQEHNIDHDETIPQPEYKYVTWKPIEWWNKKLEKPNKVLVTCPVYDGKAYCFDEWVKMAKSLTYPNYEILVVDNSKTEDFYNKYKDQIPMVHKTFRPDEKDDGMYRVCQSMAEVQKHFLKGNYTHWMNIEADNIPPADIIETLMKYSGGDADWVSHGYPALPGSKTIVQGIGCSLLSRRLMTDFDWSDTSIADDSPDSELWNWVREKGGYKTCELWYVTTVKHLR
jgi:SAM-dependent methyltransferase